jgi:hypothetical protein
MDAASKLPLSHAVHDSSSLYPPVAIGLLPVSVVTACLASAACCLLGPKTHGCPGSALCAMNSYARWQDPQWSGVLQSCKAAFALYQACAATPPQIAASDTRRARLRKLDFMVHAALYSADIGKAPQGGLHASRRPAAVLIRGANVMPTQGNRSRQLFESTAETKDWIQHAFVLLTAVVPKPPVLCNSQGGNLLHICSSRNLSLCAMYKHLSAVSRWRCRVPQDS